VRIVIVTRGQAGARASTLTLSVEVPAVPVQLVDTVGAGDTFQAAFLAWLAENDYLGSDALGELGEAHLRAALTFAVRAAAITCSRRGADMPYRSELS
jgi:fructokinase